jgi:putative oxidoreductase
MGRVATEGKVSTRIFAALRYSLAALFLYAGLVKTIHPIRFVAALENFRLVSGRYAFVTALYVPWAEVICGAALISRNWRLAGWVLAGILCSGFTIFICSAKWRNLNIACGCFGEGSQGDVTGWKVFWSLALAAATFVALIRELLIARNLLKGVPT